MKMRPCAPLTLILAHLSYFHYGRNTLQNIILAFYGCSFATSVLLLDIHILANVKSQTHHSSLKSFLLAMGQTMLDGRCPFVRRKKNRVFQFNKKEMNMFKTVQSSRNYIP